MTAALALLTAAALPFDDPETGVLRTADFELSVPATGEKPFVGVQAQLMLKPDGDFAPNVNVLTQRYGGDLEAFRKLSEEGNPLLLGDYITSEIRDDVYVAEYVMETPERQIHAYQRATLRGGLVYIVTAVATEDQWPGVEKTLRRSVDSFRLRGGAEKD